VSDERERTAERSGESAPDDDAAVADAAESFLALESRLQGGARTIGRAVDVARVPADDDVPVGYPVDITTPEALALDVVVDEETGREVTVYFEWTDGVAGDSLARLLALHDIPVDRFADLHGESVSLQYEAGHWLAMVPEETSRGSARGVYGVAGGLTANLLALVLVVAGRGGLLASLGVVAALVLVNLVVLPLSTYVDGWYLRTRTDWGQWPAFWATLAAVPGLNVASTALYLWYRRRATPLA
jgi:hypothetical protein